MTQKEIDLLIKEADQNDGLAQVNLELFWSENGAARREIFNPATMALGIHIEGECVFDELAIQPDLLKYETDGEFRHRLNKAYNDKAEKIIGQRPLNEKETPQTDKYPQLKMLHDFFEAERKWEAGSWWLEKSASGVDELSRLLDRVEERNKNPRAFMLPENWDSEKQRLTAKGIKPPRYAGQRGPVTFAMSIYGIEDLIMLILDNEPIAARFRDLITTTIINIRTVIDEESGYSSGESPHGFAFFDDNCMMLNQEMYEFFGYPILKAIFDKYAPNDNDWRYQHSDSPMGHHLPVLSRLNFTQVNFGPTLTVNEIRSHMPKTIIQGQLHPYSLMRNEREKILLELSRDFEQSKQGKGVLFATAGSVNNGSRLSTIRLIMAAIQRFCRY